MSNRGGGGGNDDWVPIAAGVVVGAGLLALIYKMFFTGCRKNVGTPFNQQINAPYKCTCRKGGKEPENNAIATRCDPYNSNTQCQTTQYSHNQPVLDFPYMEKKMCDCAKELDQRNEKKHKKKRSHSAQTDAPPRQDLKAFFSNIGGMFDGVGPWLPYIAGSAIAIMLLGFLSKNLDKLLGMFDYDDDKPAASTEEDDPYEEPGFCKAKCSMRINTNRIKWPG